MENTQISWAHDTFNPWEGCFKVSEECANCYAETRANRWHPNLKLWGPPATSSRRVTSEANWRKPLKWNTEQAAKILHAKINGLPPPPPRRVFCASLADVFEQHPALDEPRARLWDLIERTPNLTWLLLTKRPERIVHDVPLWWLRVSSGWPAHVWVGTTVGTMKAAATRIPHLMNIAAPVRFLSVEPMLEAVDLTRIPLLPDDGDGIQAHLNALTGHVAGPDDILPNAVNWVICGGESGPGARRMDPAWVDALAAQCKAAGVAFHFKQTGAVLARERRMHDKSGADPAEWNAPGWVQEVPAP